MKALPILLCLSLASVLIACGDDDESEALRRGVGDSCQDDEDCTEEGQSCLTEFKGGMCGIADCERNADCPEGSVCVSDDSLAHNYCLLICIDKPDCNAHREPEDEANCSSSLSAIEDDAGVGDPKVCIPPSSGE